MAGRGGDHRTGTPTRPPLIWANWSGEAGAGSEPSRFGSAGGSGRIAFRSSAPVRAAAGARPVARAVACGGAVARAVARGGAVAGTAGRRARGDRRRPRPRERRAREHDQARHHQRPGPPRPARVRPARPPGEHALRRSRRRRPSTAPRARHPIAVTCHLLAIAHRAPDRRRCRRVDDDRPGHPLHCRPCGAQQRRSCSRGAAVPGSARAQQGVPAAGCADGARLVAAGVRDAPGDRHGRARHPARGRRAGRAGGRGGRPGRGRHRRRDPAGLGVVRAATARRRASPPTRSTPCSSTTAPAPWSAPR